MSKVLFLAISNCVFSFLFSFLLFGQFLCLEN